MVTRRIPNVKEVRVYTRTPKGHIDDGLCTVAIVGVFVVYVRDIHVQSGDRCELSPVFCVDLAAAPLDHSL